MRRQDVTTCVAAAAAAGCSFRGAARRVHRVDAAPAADVRLVRMLLMSFVLVAVQLPQPAQAAVIRIPTGLNFFSSPRRRR